MGIYLLREALFFHSFIFGEFGVQLQGLLLLLPLSLSQVLLDNGLFELLVVFGGMANEQVEAVG